MISLVALLSIPLGLLLPNAPVSPPQVAFLRNAWDHSQVAPSEYMDVWLAVHRDLIYLPSRQRYERAASATNVDRIESIKVPYARARCRREVAIAWRS